MIFVSITKEILRTHPTEFDLHFSTDYVELSEDRVANVKIVLA